MIRNPLIRRPEAMLVGGFAALIVTGTVLLRLPVSHAGPTVGLLDAFFTATSAVCVTGLITVDTATAWTRFGQTVILALIQLGGLGIMTFGALAAQLFQRRMSFSSQAAWQSAFFESKTRGNLRQSLRWIVLLTLGFELAGLVLLRVALSGLPAAGGWYEAAFLSVSAYCNAGFSVYTDSVIPLRGSAVALITLMGLIVLGGLGYTVLLEAARRGAARVLHRPRRTVRWSLHSRTVLLISGLLIVGGAAALMVFGLTRTESALGPRAVHALFQSVTARTAGFNSVDIAALPLPSLLLLIGLMFVGGSPGSAAGGVKTTTFAVWLARVRARLTGRAEVTLLGRALPQDVVRRAALVLAVASLWNVSGVMLLAITESTHPGVALQDLIFEQVSAFATVGLSTGLTPRLSGMGKLWIIATMFVGRLGPLTIALAVLEHPRALYRYPSERVMIG